MGMGLEEWSLRWRWWTWLVSARGRKRLPVHFCEAVCGLSGHQSISVAVPWQCEVVALSIEPTEIVEVLNWAWMRPDYTWTKVNWSGQG